MKKIIDGYKAIQNQGKWYQLQQYKNIWWKQGRERQTGAYLQKVINAEYVYKQGNNNALSGCTRLVATEYLKRHNGVLIMLCVALEVQKGMLGKNKK